MRSVIICLVVIAGIFISGTVFAQMCPMPVAREGEVKQESKAPGPECPGNKMVCPVMGTIFKADKDTKSYEYEGKTYYFCCPECLNKFNTEPKKYIEGEEKPKSKPHHH